MLPRNSTLNRILQSTWIYSIQFCASNTDLFRAHLVKPSLEPVWLATDRSQLVVLWWFATRLSVVQICIQLHIRPRLRARPFVLFFLFSQQPSCPRSRRPGPFTSELQLLLVATLGLPRTYPVLMKKETSRPGGSLVPSQLHSRERASQGGRGERNQKTPREGRESQRVLPPWIRTQVVDLLSQTLAVLKQTPLNP